MALAGGGLRGVAAASLAASGPASSWASAVLAPRLPPARWLRPSVAGARALVHYGKTVALLQPLGVIHRTMDRLIVGVVLGPSAVTLVEIATQVQNGADAVLSASSYSVRPDVVLAAGPGRRGVAGGAARDRYPLLAARHLPGHRPRRHPGRPHDPALGRPRYSAAAGLATVALLYTALTAPLQVGSNLLLGVGRAKAILRAAAAAVAINLVASVLLVHAVGIVGRVPGVAHRHRPSGPHARPVDAGRGGRHRPRVPADHGACR